MKYLKIRIHRGDHRRGENQMVYPDVYDAMEVERAKFGPILYPNEIGKGASEEDCVICFHDDVVATEYLKDPGIVELSEAEVDEYMATRWERRQDSLERVTDPDRISVIQVKLAAGMELTDEDRDVLDPDKRTPGINRANKDHKLFRHRFAADNEKVERR